MESKSSTMKHSPWGPSTLPRLRKCPGSYHAILAAKEAGDIPWTAPPKDYNIQGQKEHDACYAISTAKDRTKVEEHVFDTLLDTDPEAIARVKFALEQVDAIIASVNDSAVMDEPIILFEEASDPKHFFKTFLAGKYIIKLPEQSLAGTVDVIIYDKENNILYIIDYKFGWVNVSVKNNDQFLGYAMGALGKWCIKNNPPDEIHTIVIQPQGYEKVKRAVYTFEQIVEHATQTYVSTVVNSLDPGAPLNPSEENCLFCELDGVCRAQKSACLKAFESAPVEQMPALDDEELGRVVKSIPLIKRWIKAAEAQCYQRQINGRRIPFRKLVRGTKHRRWLDKQKALKFLAARGIKKENREIVQPPSPNQAAALLKNVSMTKRGWTAFDNLWEKPPGELKSVPIDDPKPEVHVADEVKQEFMEADPDKDMVVVSEELGDEIEDDFI